MKISDLRGLLKDKRVIEEINKHLWIESQKVGYSIGIERATDEWLSLYAIGWMKYNMSDKYEKIMKKKEKSPSQKTSTLKKAASARKTPSKKKVASKKAQTKKKVKKVALSR